MRNYLGFAIPAEIQEEGKKPIAVTKVSYGIKQKFAFLTGKISKRCKQTLISSN